MPALQTGHLVLYQTVSCGLISNLTVESNNTIAARAGRAQRRDGYSRFATSSSMTSVAPPPIASTRASRQSRSITVPRM